MGNFYSQQHDILVEEMSNANDYTRQITLMVQYFLHRSYVNIRNSSEIKRRKTIHHVI